MITDLTLMESMLDSVLIYMEEDTSDISPELFQEADVYSSLSNANIKSHYLIERIYPKVEKVLATPIGDRKFKQLVGNFIDTNNEKLHAPGPMDMIAFTDRDKISYLDLFGIEYTVVKRSSGNVIKGELPDAIKDVTKQIGTGKSFRLLEDNPIFWLFYCVIRYYTLTKSKTGLNCALAIYALSVYPSVFHKYFEYGVTRPGVMLYTVDQLSNKYILKQQGHIFGALMYSINNSYKYLAKEFVEGPDREIIRWIERIRNDQNSMMRKIREQYEINLRAGNSLSTQKDSYDDVPIVDDHENNTSLVESLTNTTVLSIMSNGISDSRVQICAKMCEVNVSDTRFALSKILTDKSTSDVRSFVESILYIYLYDEKHKTDEIKSKNFLLWAAALFRKTNSQNPNISNIKMMLDKWSKDTGLHNKYKREASRINYKRAIFFYFIFSIQAYI